jgi:hypothetical protein
VRIPRVLYHLARADFLERSRGYGFLILLCLSLYLGYAVNMGQVVLRFNTCLEIFDSAWVGIMAAIAINFFLGFFGFYLAKGSIERDERTGVGQIMAATPMRRIEYVFGKWLSNYMVLGALVMILALGTVVIQSFRTQELNPFSLLSPFLWLTLPFMALVAAAAILFETLPWTRGGLGNLIYFFLFVFLLITVTSSAGGRGRLLSDPSGIRILLQEIESAGLDCGAKTSLAELTDVPVSAIQFSGIAWGADVTLSRLGIFGSALALTAVSGMAFNRFDPSKTGTWKQRGRKFQEKSETGTADIPGPAIKPVRLTPLPASRVQHNNLARIVLAEARLLLKGHHWSWTLGAAALWIFSLIASADSITLWLSAAALWPLLLWSKMGMREAFHRTHQIVFSCAHPVLRLLTATWMAGVLVTAVLWSGAGINFLLHAQTANLIAWSIAVLLVPSVALMSGTWTGTAKVFEVLYLVIWYAGIANRLPALDFIGLTPAAIALRHPAWMIAFLTACLMLALAGRRRRQTV